MASVLAVAAVAAPIPDPFPTTLPDYQGAPADARGFPATRAPHLIYTYTREPAPPLEQPYFWTAIDARTGATAYKVYVGSGLAFNNNYAGLALGGDGTAYLGVIGGIVALREP